MNIRRFLELVLGIHTHPVETDDRIRERSARTLEAEAALHKAIAEEARSRGLTDSAKDRMRLARTLEEEAAMTRLSDEYAVIRGGDDAK